MADDGVAPATDDVFGSATDDVFGPAFDAHVHVMPARLMAAIRGALFDLAAWEFDHPVDPDAMAAALTDAGVERYFALPYAHKSGIARELNTWVLANAGERAVPFATVHGDDDVEDVVRDAFDAGARGLKFQCPVQECGPADPRLDPAFELAAAYDRPIVFHAGTAPMFEDSPHVGADQFRSFVASYPSVRACCAHMGAYEVDAFVELACEHDQVFLDTTFTMSTAATQYADFDPSSVPDAVFEDLAGSVMYGSDFPNIPHPLEAERAGLLARELSEDARRELFYTAATRFLGENPLRPTGSDAA